MGRELSEQPVVELDTAEINRLLASDPAQAARVLEDAARRDRADAQAWLGQMYLDGQGVERNAPEALYWFQRAAHAAVPMAMNMLGRCYENGWGAPADFELALVWYRRAAAQNLDWAIYNLAQMHANGRAVTKDRAEAFRLFTRAAALGHARAKHFLGQFYEYGWEVEANQQHAFRLYREAAEGGDYRGMCSWASVLAATGQVEEAAAWIRRATPLAPAHYLEPLAAQLEQASQPVLRELSAWVRQQPATR